MRSRKDWPYLNNHQTIEPSTMKPLFHELNHKISPADHPAASNTTFAR
jgi:hypothetical protein